MAGAFDILDRLAAAQQPGTPDAPAPEPSLGDDFSAGLRSGGYAMRGQLNTLAGTAMDAVGLGGSDRRAASQWDRAQAQVAGQNLVPMSGVHDLHSGLRYAAGTVGQIAPMAGAAIGAGLLTGGGALPAMAAGTAATVPFELGGQLQRQEADPANDLATPMQRLGAAAPAAIGSSLVQNILPAGVAGRLAGKAGAQTLGRIALRGGADIPANAAAGGITEGIRQFGDNQLNPNAGYNPDAIKTAAEEGGVAGVMFGGLGAAGHLAHSFGAKAAGLPGQAIDAAKGLVPGKTSEAPGGAVDAAFGGSDTTPPGGTPPGAPDAANVAPKDIPTRLNDLFQSIKTSGADILNKVAGGKEVGDPDAPDPQASFEQADQTILQKAQEWGKNLMAQNLGPEKAAQLQQFMATVGDKASQQGIAAMQVAQNAVQAVKGAASRFSDAVNAKVATDSAPSAEGAPKLSEDYSGTRKAVVDAVSNVLGPDHPAMQDPATMMQLADGLRPFIEQVQSGTALDSMSKIDHLVNLFDVTGDKTSAVLTAVHQALTGPGADHDTFTNTLNQVEQVRQGKQSVLETMQKNLRPELQDSVRPGDLQTEAALLDKWAQSKSTRLGSQSEMDLRDTQVKSALAHRYGDKADVVLAAVEKNVKQETSILDTAGTTERTTEDGVSSVHYYPQKGQLYLHPDLDKGKNGYESAAAQAMKRAQRDNPEASVQFRRASEIGLDDKMVQAKHADLVDEAKTHGLTDEQAQAHADKKINDFGTVTAEQNRQETALNPGELDKVRLDTHSFPNSPSRIDAGKDAAGKPMAIDAVKLTQLMHEKLKDHFTTNDDTGKRARDANMFKEGVAAVQSHLGRSFDIPDETRIAKSGMTWGEAKKLDVSTDADKASDAATKRIDELRKAYKAATTIKDRAEIAKEGKKLVGAKEGAVIKEQGHDSHSGEDDTVDAGKVAPDLKGNIHAALKGGDNPDAIVRTNLSGNSRADDVQGRRAPARSIDEGAPPDPKARAAAQAAFVKKARSGDKALLKEVATSENSKGLQRAVDHLASLKDVNDPHVTHVVDTINDRLAELVQKPGEAYGLQTKKYSLQSDVVHASLERPGFPAAHDSPIKHEGVFDWRTHALKGEGAMVKGAGTYLSTGDQAHGYYKKAFTEMVNDAARRRAVDGNTAIPERTAKSPTYHVSVDIDPKHLLNWDKPLSQQSATVRLRAMKALKDNRLTHDGGDGDPLGMDTRGEDLYRNLSEKLGGDRQASDYLQSLGIDGHSMKAGGKSENPNYVIYNDAKIHTNYVHFSQERADPNATGPAADRKAVEDHIEKVLGPQVSVAWKFIDHAGEFDRTKTGDVVGLSVHSLNPMATAFHESLHGFFAHLKDGGHTQFSDVLEKAGASEHVMGQLKELLKNEPAALKQLSDPEERAAYMYQFHQLDKLTVSPAVKSIFGRIAKFLRSVTGYVTNSERAEQIMNYFHSGEYEKNRSDPSAVSRALAEPMANQAVAKLKAATEPFRQMADTLATAGGARLRDTGIPALRQLADTMQLKTTSQGTDPGYLPAARAEHARRMNQLFTDLKPYSKDVIAEATEAMQNGTKAQSLAARTVAVIMHRHLDDALDYMQKAGVNISAIGLKDGVKYFPRSWDAGYISGHQREFLAMMTKNGVSDPRAVMNKMMVTDGAEFHINTDGLNKPGMQNAKERVLSFIPHADAAPFMRKDLPSIMNTYVMQAARRAEWARRLGDDGSGVNTLLVQAAKQGATPQQLDAGRKFVQAVDGTLGDNLNPTARRMMGNMIVYQNLRLLPLAIFSSAVDPQGIIVRGGTMGDAFKTFMRGMKDVKKNFQADPTADKMTQLSEAIGTVDSAIMVHTLGASYSQGMVGNLGRKINDTLFRMNLMEQFNTSMRVGATEAAMGFLTRHATQPGQHSARFLGELGLKASDVQLTPEGRPKILESDGLSLEHSAKMKAAVNRWVDGAVLRPNAVDKPVWMSDPNYALLAHLKQFVFAFHETILKRVAHEVQHGNYAPAMALASYVPVMIAADALKGLIQGGGQQPSWKDRWGPADYAWSGMERAGLFGIPQFGIDAMGDIHHGGNGTGALLGPTMEQFTEALKTMGGREQFKQFAVKSLPANALYASALHGDASDPQFSD